ncbi:DUF1853 family protein [Dokdonia ponticola]|uniref:DUF1853 family protein n=1 Tax=Dokdonia ponticola TaxID=2041041 RepID=A0ABV9I1E7_9FLAO
MKHIHGFLASSPLWKGTQFGLQQFELPPLDLTHFEPTPIPEKLRLGHQIEYIFHQLVSHLDPYEVIAHNIQIKKGNDTVGELDFLIRSSLPARQFRETCQETNQNSKKLLHLELTYKFYIIDPTIADPIHQLVGPNRKDAFFAKLEKTKQKQLPLVFTEEGIQTLTTLGIDPTEINQKVLFMGQIFTPYHTSVPSIAPLQTDCIVGYWVHMHDFELDDFKAHTYYITYKSEWIHIPHNEVSWSSHQEILPKIHAKHQVKRAPMLWIKKADHSIDKCFVVWW